MPDAARALALRRALAPPVVHRSLVVALVVGTVLNAINQGDVAMAGGNLNWWKCALTYCVPFCVSTYGAYSAVMVTERSR